MNRRLFVIIILLISIALIGLVGIQLYWIRNAIAIKEANFERAVNQAISNVIYRLEKYEVADKIRSRVYANQHGSAFFNTIDSINNIFNQQLIEMENSGDTGAISNNIFNVTSEKIRVEVIQEQSGEIIRRYDTSIIKLGNIADGKFQKTIIPEKEQKIDSSLDNRNETNDTLDSELDRFFKQTILISDVLEDMFSVGHYPHIENRVDFLLMDSLITHELKIQGIYTSYEFGIYSPMRNLMILESTAENRDMLLQEGHAFNLFPRDLFIAPEYLLIYFPNRKNYLLKQMWGMMTLSALLILTIVFSFIYALLTIYKQKKLSEMKTDFINNMTHEIKTPISTISLACEALNDNDVVKTQSVHSTYVNMISEENKRLGVLTENILQTAIRDKGKLKLQTQKLRINELVEDAIKNIQLQVKTRDGQVEVSLDAEKDTVYADKVHMTNVIFNLLDNAIKYSENKPNIKVSSKNEKDQIVVSIKDHGIGINKSNQKRVFESLYRVPTGNIHNVKGFGLGLSYVKAIVEQHSGKVKIESEPAKGTTVSFYLPLSENDPHE